MKRIISFILTLTLLWSICSPVGSALTTTPQVASGSDHALILQKNGTLWAWGSNYEYQLGDGTETSRITKPVKIGTGFTAIAAGHGFSIALKGKDLYAWGNVHTGAKKPTKIGTGFTAIAAGSFHYLALKGTDLYSWGLNEYGALGNGTTKDNYTGQPKKVGTGFSAIAAGQHYSMGLKGADLYCWGWNSNGQLGDGTKKDRYSPRKVKGTGFTAISAGFHVSLALKGNTLYQWGWSDTLPVKIGTGYTKISAGREYYLALKNKDVYGLGANWQYQLGTKNEIFYDAPTRLGTGFTAIAAMHVGISIPSMFSLALKGDDLYIAGYRPGEREEYGTEPQYEKWTKISLK